MLSYRVTFKNFFFDRPKVQESLEYWTYKGYYFFGVAVREQARKKIGVPSKAGAIRDPGKAPRARSTSKVMTLRNVQYAYLKGGWKKRLPFKSAQTSVKAGVPIFKGTKRYSGKSIPEIQEFGGRIKTGILKTVAKTKTGRVRKKNGQPVEKVRFGPWYPKKVNIKIPARPYLAPSLKPAVKAMWRRLKSQKVE